HIWWLLQLIFLYLLKKANGIHKENLRIESDLFKYSIRFDELCKEQNSVYVICILDTLLDHDFFSKQATVIQNNEFKMRLKRLKKMKMTESNSSRILIFSGEFTEIIDAIVSLSPWQGC